MSNESLYFVALVPPSPIFEEVMAQKNYVAEHFGSKAALRSPPHITLHMPFKWKENKESLLLNAIEAFSFDQYPFQVTLKNYDFFPPKVVFVDVEKNEALVNLQKQLAGYLRRHLNLLNADYKNRAFHPHMTIAFRDLKKTVFHQARAYYEAQTYSRTFEVRHIQLLKHNGKQWEIYKEI